MVNNFVNEKKRLLLIAPLFFGYYADMLSEAEKLGFEVNYICDAPSNSNLSKAIGRINKKLIKGTTEKYFYHTVLPQTSKVVYDCVLLVAGMTFAFQPEMIRELKEQQKKARFVMYQWDSEKNLPYSTKIHRFFDDVYTFDRFDAETKDFYRFLPLFYTQIYETIGRKKSSDNQYDCIYVGTAHPQKFRDINRMADRLKKVMPKQFVYHYMPSRLKYYYHKLFAPEFKLARWSDFGTEKVSSVRIMELLQGSRCVLDAPQAGQTGLTIRTIECLGAKRKLVTINTDIVNYDFYREANILVYSDRINFEGAFFTKQYEELPDEIYENYSLHHWLKAMLGGVLKED